MSDDVPAEPAIDGKHFRAVLGHFPTGVTIVTGMAGVAGDTPAGFTIGSFTSVSLDPPLVAFLPMTDSDTWEAIAPSGRFCVNVLKHDQGDLCWRFAKRDVADGRFDTVSWHLSPLGSPVIDDVGAWIDCTVDQVVELGDHLLVVGAVSALDHHSTLAEPLIFYRGALGGFLASD